MPAMLRTMLLRTMLLQTGRRERTALRLARALVELDGASRDLRGRPVRRRARFALLRS